MEMNTSVDHMILGMIVMALLVWIYLRQTKKDDFNAFYYGARRDPNDFKRAPFSTK